MAKIITTRTYGIIIGLFPVIQVILDTLNTAQLDSEIRMYIGAISMFCLILLDGFKKYFNPEIENNGIWITILMLVVFVIGGVLDNSNTFQMTENIKSIFRIITTILIYVIGQLSNLYYSKL